MQIIKQLNNLRPTKFNEKLKHMKNLMSAQEQHDEAITNLIFNLNLDSDNIADMNDYIAKMVESNYPNHTLLNHKDYESN